MVYRYTMLVRKQFHLERSQEKALKRRAKQLGVSETEVVRRAIALVLRDNDAEHVSADQDQAASALVESMKEAAQKYALPNDWVFDREQLHEDREQELFGRLRQ